MSVRKGTQGCPHPQISRYGTPAVGGPGRYIQTRGMSRCHAASREVRDHWPLQPDRGQCACFVFAAFEKKLIYLSLSFTCFVVAQDPPPSKRQHGRLQWAGQAFLTADTYWIITLRWGSVLLKGGHFRSKSDSTRWSQDSTWAGKLAYGPCLLLSPEFKHEVILEVFKCSHLRAVTCHQIIKAQVCLGLCIREGMGWKQCTL